MELPKITRFLWCYLTILLAFGQVLVAQLPKVEPEIPKDGLQIRLERELFGKQQSVVYASHLEFDEEPEISDRQFLKIAIDAFKEMRHMVDENKLGKKKIPNVMTTLLVGKEMIFASSAKGSNDPIKEDGQVQDDLAECGKGSENKHKNNGRCGEVMAFHEYYESRVDPKKLDKDSGARIVAIAFPRDADLATAQPEILAPCGSGDNWGCNRLVKDLNVLDNDKVAADPEMAEFDYKKLRNEGKLKSVKTKLEEGNGSKPGDKSGKNKLKGPPPNNLPPRPNKERPSTPADTGDDGDSEDKKVEGGKKQGPPPNKLPPRPPKEWVETPPAAGDFGDDKEVDTSGKKKGPPPNNLPPRPPKQRPSTPVESGDDGDDKDNGDKESNGGKKKKPRPHGKPPPRVHHRSRAPDQDGEKSGHGEPRDADKAESSAQAPGRHESRRYFRA
ncbi:hypothetical protein BBO_05682 [Beauveria brongniartii RCEF 3172]|uniref:Uncharacterized protein n=1 Tax=Beauveria brongniartii RCEF 3172 TaxID=1081107 RepID=A0A167CFN1_9HYPO|nr:hypothetical protein BBO_05682 [Beauveria brongniartii RCEF 3172]